MYREIIDAVRANNIEEVRRLIEFNTDLDVKDDYNNTALHYAVCRNYVEIMLKL